MNLKPSDYLTLRNLYASYPRMNGQKRTHAIADSFKIALNDTSLKYYRPDEIWTALNRVYVDVESDKSFSDLAAGLISKIELTDNLQSIRNGWVKSSGTAFEYFIEVHYDYILKTSTNLRLLSKSSSILRDLRPTNLPSNNQIDDLYLLVRHGNAWMIFAMISAQASGGDRWLRGEQRCHTLRTSGINCINLTLDPRDISRSPNGNLTQPDYLVRFQSANPSYNAHFVIDEIDAVMPIPTSVDSIQLQQPSRLFKADVRSSNDYFVMKAINASKQFVSNGNTLPSTYNW